MWNKLAKEEREARCFHDHVEILNKQYGHLLVDMTRLCEEKGRVVTINPTGTYVFKQLCRLIEYSKNNMPGTIALLWVFPGQSSIPDLQRTAICVWYDPINPMLPMSGSEVEIQSSRTMAEWIKAIKKTDLHITDRPLKGVFLIKDNDPEKK